MAQPDQPKPQTFTAPAPAATVDAAQLARILETTGDVLVTFAEAADMLATQLQVLNGTMEANGKRVREHVSRGLQAAEARRQKAREIVQELRSAQAQRP